MAAAEQLEVRASGGCLCGAIRYAVGGPLRGVILCHCGQCRRWHGHVGAYTSAARADVALEGAEGLVWFASSERGRRGFCASCGSSLFFEAQGGDRLAIAAGSLDQPSGLVIIGHEYVADKADYVRMERRPAGLRRRLSARPLGKHPEPSPAARRVAAGSNDAAAARGHGLLAAAGGAGPPGTVASRSSASACAGMAPCAV